MRIMFYALLASLSVHSAFAETATKATDVVRLEEMTWQEVRDAVKAGKTTVIVPTGGTEQNGPHLVLGKHNFTLQYTADAIARKLGNTLVAPILPYVPEGDIDPPTNNMMFPGTLTIGPEVFSGILDNTARSLKLHGFKTICFVGEHGGSQSTQSGLAWRLSEQWAKEGVKVVHVNAYFDDNGQNEYLASIGEKDPNPQAHGGLADTSEMLAMHPEGVRENLRGPYKEEDVHRLGVMGPSDRATKEIGMKLVELKIDAAVKQIDKERQHK